MLSVIEKKRKKNSQPFQMTNKANTNKWQVEKIKFRKRSIFRKTLFKDQVEEDS